MKKIYYPLACCLIGGILASCGGGAKKSNATEEAAAPTTTALSYSKSLKAPETDSLNLPIDADGYITNFDGKYTEMIQSYCLQTIPFTYILDEDNMIVDKGLSGDILREKIGELLKKNK